MMTGVMWSSWPVVSFVVILAAYLLTIKFFPLSTEENTLTMHQGPLFLDDLSFSQPPIHQVPLRSSFYRWGWERSGNLCKVTQLSLMGRFDLGESDCTVLLLTSSLSCHHCFIYGYKSQHDSKKEKNANTLYSHKHPPQRNSWCVINGR